MLRVVGKLVKPRYLQALPCASIHHKSRIGNRDVVGYGYNGEANYADRLDFPLPAVRFRENTSDVMSLRQKEKGDWKNLSLEEKKSLYRASFCQTFAEMKAPTGQWKQMVSGLFVATTLALWIYIWLKKYVYPPMPKSLSPESKAAQLKRMIDLEANPIEGVASKWDYEKGRWKE